MKKTMIAFMVTIGIMCSLTYGMHYTYKTMETKTVSMDQVQSNKDVYGYETIIEFDSIKYKNSHFVVDGYKNVELKIERNIFGFTKRTAKQF